MTYVGRFAPSPTGPLHAGSLVAALASWLDAKASHGHWLLRIEDVDAQRCKPAFAEIILGQLAALGLHSDAPVIWQSSRGAVYAAALQQLQDADWVYACTCSRAQVAQLGQRVYPGTCRDRPPAQGFGERLAWRMRSQRTGLAQRLTWHDRRLGAQSQDLAAEVGDFVLRRSDGLWAYQLAVVVDDAAQSVNHVVRGEDLCDNTARQLWLQQALGLPRPVYLHLPVVRNAQGQKLSKQQGARALDVSQPLLALRAAAQHLALPDLCGQGAGGVADWLAAQVLAWPDALVRLRHKVQLATGST